MARRNCKASTVVTATVLSFVIGGLILCIGVLNWEYTEEIERLRRDLVATREKNGVHLSYESYTELVSSKDVTEKELTEKLGKIKALEEEKEKMGNIFEEMKGTISKYEEELKTVCLQRDEQSHLVEKQVETENKLKKQGRTLISVADESISDLSKLHAKLDRRRSVDTENESKIPPFLESFHREVDRMSDEVVRGIQDQLKTCTGQSEIYGQLMEKRVRELNAQRSLLDRLVDGMTVEIESQKTTATLQTKSTQEFISAFRNTQRGHFGSQSAHQSTAFSENFIPAIVSTARHMSNCAAEIEHLRKNIKVETDRMNEIVSTFSTEQRDLLDRIRTANEHFVNTQMTGYERIKERSKAREMELLQQVQTSEDKIDDVISLLENIKKKDFVTVKERVSNSTEEVSAFTDAAKQDASRFGSDMNTLLVDASNREKDFGTKITKLKKENFEINHAIVDRVGTEVRRMGEITAQLELDVKSHLTTHETNWNAIFEAEENELRKYGDEQNGFYATCLNNAQAQSNSLHSARQNHESLIEEQSSDFSGFVRERQEELERQCSSLNDLTQFVNVAFRSRKEEVEKFLTEELARDVPTGQTPQRREFSYPRVLAQTSPHAKILERFKLELQESNDVDNFAVPEPRTGGPMKAIDLNVEKKSASVSDLTAISEIKLQRSVSMVEAKSEELIESDDHRPEEPQLRLYDFWGLPPLLTTTTSTPKPKLEKRLCRVVCTRE